MFLKNKNIIFKTRRSKVTYYAALKDILSLKTSPLVHDLPTSENDRVISPLRESFIFAKLRSFAKIKLRENIRIYSEPVRTLDNSTSTNTYAVAGTLYRKTLIVGTQKNTFQ